MTIALYPEFCIPFLFYRWRKGNRLVCLFKWWRWVVRIEAQGERSFDYFPSASMAAKWMAEQYHRMMQEASS